LVFGGFDPNIEPLPLFILYASDKTDSDFDYIIIRHQLHRG
jgi:hypothetical protein